MATEDIKNKSSQEQQMPDKGRRDALKTLATVPVLGALAYGVYKTRKNALQSRNISDVFQVSNKQAVFLEPQKDGKQIRLGIIGFGIRGKQLMRAAGFAEPSWIDEMKEANRVNKKDHRYEQYLEQDDLNVVVNGVCDIFDVYGEAAQLAGSNIYREGSDGKFGPAPKRYRTYQELLAAPDIDAVIIAGPDHWHSTMAMDAARAGKHVYCEKPLSWTVPETYMVRQVIKETGVVFQLGHQGRQTDCYQKAEEIIGNGLLGPVNLIEVCTNRNSPNGAWVYDIIEGANPNTIDWKQFEGNPDRIKEYMDYMTKYGLERYVGPLLPLALLVGLQHRALGRLADPRVRRRQPDHARRHPALGNLIRRRLFLQGWTNRARRAPDNVRMAGQGPDDALQRDPRQQPQPREGLHGPRRLDGGIQHPRHHRRPGFDPLRGEDPAGHHPDRHAVLYLRAGSGQFRLGHLAYGALLRPARPALHLRKRKALRHDSPAHPRVARVYPPR